MPIPKALTKMPVSWWEQSSFKLSEEQFKALPVPPCAGDTLFGSPLPSTPERMPTGELCDANGGGQDETCKRRPQDRSPSDHPSDSPAYTSRSPVHTLLSPTSEVDDTEEGGEVRCPTVNQSTDSVRLRDNRKEPAHRVRWFFLSHCDLCLGLASKNTRHYLFQG